MDGRDAEAPDRLRLADFRPRSQLRARAVAAPGRPSIPAIDAHNHLGATPFSDGWDRRTPSELAAALDASNITAIVDLDGGWGETLRRELEHWGPLAGRVAVFAGLDYAMWSERSDFGEVEAARLREAASVGASGLKVWKML